MFLRLWDPIGCHEPAVRWSRIGPSADFKHLHLPSGGHLGIEHKGGLHGDLEQQPRRLVFPGAPGHEGARDGPYQLLPGIRGDDPARRRLPVQSQEYCADLTGAAVY